MARHDDVADGCHTGDMHMVAVIAGNGLGLGNTSLRQLGQGLGGQAAIGQGNVSQYVNTATGNLVLQTQDEGLIFDGLPLDVLRTYNSQGQLSGSAGWQFGFSRSIGGLTGTLDTAGSTITRTDDDGSAVTYIYNATLGQYVSAGQSGAQDSLSWNATASSWTWTDSVNRQLETYNASGQLTTLSDAETGASYGFSYSNGQLSQIVAGDGDTLVFGYNTANQLISLSIQEVPPGQTTAVTRQQVSYAYDSHGRLSTVATLLASDTDSSTASYTTTYTYSGTSDRVASVTQSDGTTVSYAYTEDAQGAYQVTRITTGTGPAAQVVRLSYGAGSTTVTNAPGQSWVYSYNAAGDLTQVAAPKINGTTPTTTYSYDANGNLLSTTNADGATTTYGYDASGNLLSVEDGAGNTVSYTYNTDDQVLSKTIYTVPAQGVVGQSGYVAPSGAQTTYYVYNAADQLSYVIDALGNVTENTYATTAAGISVLSSTQQYLGVQYSTANLTAQTPPSLADMQDWVASSAVQGTLSQSTRTDYTYDVRGQLATQTQWDTVGAGGVGLSDTGTAVTTTTYSAQGQLLQTSTQDGGALQTTSYAYDGLGRLVSSTDPLGHVTSYVYTDSNNTLAITQANGLTTTQVRNSAGQIISSVQSASGQASRTTTYVYNTAGQQVAQIDPVGNVSYSFYNVDGQVAGTVDADGNVIAYTYDADGNATQAIQYATQVSTTGWMSAGALTTSFPTKLPIPASSVNDSKTTTVYDLAGRAVATIGAEGNVVTRTYDGTGNVVISTTYATFLTAGQRNALGSTPTLAALQADLVSSTANRTTLTFYDADDRAVATVDPVGTVRTISYDAAGNVVTSRVYTTSLTAAQMATLASTPTLATLLALLDPTGQQTIYDANNRPVATIDAQGNVITTTYDAAGNVTASTAYATPLTVAQVTALGSTPTLAELMADLSPSASDQTNLKIYDANERVVGTVDPSGTVTTIDYDASGNVIATTQYATPLTATQVAALGSSPTLAALQADISPSTSDLTTLTIYDANNRAVATVSPAGNVTTTVYDSNGNAIASTVYATPLTAAQLAALGDDPTLAAVQADLSPGTSDLTTLTLYDANNRAVATVSAGGVVTTTTYDANGNAIASTVYATPLTAAQMTALGDAPTFAAVQADLTPGSGDLTTLTIYDAQNQAVASIDGEGYVTTTTYDVAGHAVFSETSATPLTAAQMTALGSTPTLAALQTDLEVNAGGQIALTIYDANERPVAVINSNGMVTTTIYDSAGNVTGTTQYATLLTAAQLAALGPSPTLAALEVDLSPSPNDIKSLTIYDSNERVIATVSTARLVTTTAYDAAGNVTETTQHAIALTSAQIASLGSTPTLAALQALLSPGNDIVTVTIYDAQERPVATITPVLVYGYESGYGYGNYYYGRVTTTTYNAAGSITATKWYSTPLTPSQMEALGDAPTLAAVAAVLTPANSDQTTVTIYDAQNRPVAVVSTASSWVYNGNYDYENYYGVVATTTYDAAGNVVATELGRQITISQVAGLATTPTLAALQTALDDAAPTTLTVYDANERPAAVIYSTGFVITTSYDSAGNITETRQYAVPLTAAQMLALGNMPTLSTLQADLSPGTQDTVTLSIYDANERPVAMISPKYQYISSTGTYGYAGQVVTTTYDAAGNITAQTQYATLLTPAQLQALGSTPTLAALQADLSPSASDLTTLTIYDSNERLVGAVTSSGNVTINTYDSAGNITAATQYATPLTASQIAALGDAPTLAALQADLSPSPDDSTSLTIYDSNEQIVGAVTSSGNVTINTYDSAGNITATTQYATPLTASQIAALGDAPTLAALQADLSPSPDDSTSLTIYDSNEQIVGAVTSSGNVTINTYDSAGNITATTQYATQLTASQIATLGDTPTLAALQADLSPSPDDSTSLTIYDDQHRPVAVVSAPQDVYDPVSGTYIYGGVVTTTSYDSAGNVTETMQYETQLTTTQIASLGTAPTLAALQAILTPSDGDLTTLTVYDANNRVVGTVDTNDDVTITTYGGAGGATVTTKYATPLTIMQIQALGDAPTLAALQADVTPGDGSTTGVAIYDADDRVVGEVSASGAVTITTYNDAGSITSTTQYATPLTTAQMTALGSTPTLSALRAEIIPNDTDQLTLTIYDANNRPIAWVTPETTYNYYYGYEYFERVSAATYDASGNVVAMQQYVQTLTLQQAIELGSTPTLDELHGMLAIASGNQTKLTIHDANERVVATVSTYGQVTTTSYDSDGNIIATTRYAVPLNDAQIALLGDTPTLSELQADLSPSAYDQTSLTIYDAEDRPVAVVSPTYIYDPTTGEDTYGWTVTATSYDSAGNVTSTRQYAKPLTAAQVAALGDTPTLAALENELSPSNSDIISLTVYDANENVVGEVSSNRVAIITGYDHAGNVTSTTQYATRLTVAQVQALGNAPTLFALQADIKPSSKDRTSLTIYDANENVVGTVSASGIATTASYDSAGNVTSTTQYANPLTVAQVEALAEAPSLAALQASVTPASGDRTSLTIYDANENVVGVVSTSGVVTTTTYDANGNITATTEYATPLTWEQAEALAATPTLAGLEADLSPSNSDRTSLTVYDTDGNVVAAVATNGTVATTTYDAAGNITAMTQYATRLTAAQVQALGNAPTLAALQAELSPSSGDRTSLTIFDANERVIGAVDTNGYVTTTSYDAAGNVIATVQYNARLSTMQIAELGSAPTMTMLQADMGIASGASASQTIYDASGHSVATINASGQVTTTTYDAAGNITAITQYATPLSAGHGYFATMAALLAAIRPSSGDLTTRTIYDADNRPVATIDATGHVVFTRYDGADDVATVTDSATVLTQAQLAQLGDAPTLGALEMALNPTTQTVYNAANRPVAVIDPQGNVTYSFYDADGQLIGTVGPTGAVTAYGYDADGNVIRTTQYATLVSTAGWMSDGVLTTAFPASLPVPASSSADRTTQVIHDAVGQPVATIDAEGNVATTTYDAEGNAIASTAYAVPLTTGQLAALGSAPTLSALQADLSPGSNDRTTRTIYDADNRAVATIDAGGDVTVATYDAIGNAIASTSYATPLSLAQMAALGSAPTLAALQADLTTSAQDQTTLSFYDSQGRVVAQIDADGYLTTMAYSQATHTTTTTRYATALTDSQLSSVTSNETVTALVGLLGTQTANEQSSVTYNAEGQPTSSVAADGTRTTYVYDDAGRLVSTTSRPTTGQGGARTTSATYDASGNMLTRRDATGTTTTDVYNTLSQLQESTDAIGNSTWYYYDADGRLAYVIQGQPGTSGVLNALGDVTAYQYNAFGQVTTTTAYASQLTLNGNEGSGTSLNPAAATLAQVAAAVAALPASAIDANAVSVTTYTADGQVATATDGDGYATADSYDAFGDLIQVTKQLSAPGSALSAANDVTTQYSYDSRGEQIGETDAAGTSVARTTQTTYDAFGRVSGTTDGNGNNVSYTYDNLGRQITSSQIVQGVTRTTQASYDAFGQVLTQTDALGNVTTYQYVLATHTITMTTPDGVTITTVKDAYGDTLSVTDGAGDTTRYTYNNDGRLLTTTDALQNVSTNQYNADGELVRSTDANGTLVTYTYDASGHVLTRRFDPFGLNQITRYTYDGEGRQLSVTDPLGTVTAYGYDADGNLLSEIQNAGEGKLNLTTTFSYDGDGNVLTTTAGAGSSVAVTTQFVYDTLGRLIQKVVDPDGLAQITRYAYDADNHLVQTTDADGNSTYTIYNQANEAVYTITPAGAQGANQGLLTQSSYDADGRLVSTRIYATPVDTGSLNTLAGSGTQASLASGAALAAGAASATDAVNYSVYDADGNLRYSIDPLGDVSEIRYNALGQVAATLDYAMPIDVTSLAASLQAGTAQASDIQQALSTAGDTDATARITYTYYDADGRVAYTATPNLVNGVLGAIVSHTNYDADGHVIASIVYGVPLPLTDIGTSATTASIAQAVTQLNTSATTRTTQYIYNSAGEQVALVDPDGNVSYTFYTADGQVSATVDATGAVVQYTRDALGRVTRQTAYATTVDSSGWLDNGVVTVTLAAALPSSDPSNDRITLTTYDAVGRVATVRRYSQVQSPGDYYDPTTGQWTTTYTYKYTDGDTLTYTYDAASNVVQTVDVDLSRTSATRTTRYFYDAGGNTIGTLDANGYLSTRSYDAAGQLVQSVSYATATAASLRAKGTLAQLVPAASAGDQTTSNDYDARGNLVGTLDADGYFTQYTYDRDDRQLRSTRYATAVTGVAAENLASIVAALAGTAAQQTSNTYDSYGELASQTDAEGTLTQYTYDGLGRVLQTTVAAGTGDARTTSATYDAFGNQASTTDGMGNVTTSTYDMDGNRTSFTDALGNTTWYVYDPNGRLVYTIRGVADASGTQNALGEVSETDYDTFGDVSSTEIYSGRIPVGTGFVPTLAGVGSAVSAIADDSDDLDGNITYQYDLEGNVIYKQDGNDDGINYSYDGFNDLVWSQEKEYDGLIRLYTYDALGHMTSEVDELGNIDSSGEAAYATTAQAQPENFVSSGSGGSGGNLDILRELQWTYDAFGRVATYTDGDGTTTHYGYDDLNQELTQSLSVLGAVRETSTSYDAYGRVFSTTDAMGLVTSYAYDEAGRSMTVTSPGGVVTMTSYSREGQAMAVTDAAGHTTSYQYDADGRLLETVNPDGSTVVDQYDAVGNLIQTQDADGHVVAYTYDAAGRVLTQTVDPAGLDLVTSYSYDGRGLEVSVTDPTGVTTTYTHDGNGNVREKIVDAGTATGDLNITTSYHYTDQNEIFWTETTSPQSGYEEIDYEYDALGRLTYESSDTGGVSSTRYSYDADGNVVQKTDGNRSSTYYFYDEAGEQIYSIAPIGGNGLLYYQEGYVAPSGAVTQTFHNADGAVVATRQYANAVSTSTFALAASLADPARGELETALDTVATWVEPSSDDSVSYQVYNANGQLQYNIDPTGAVTETRYNAAGQVSETLAYANAISISTALASSLQAGTASAADMQAVLTSAGDSDAAARLSYSYYDNRGRVIYTVSSASIDGSSGGLVKATQYDADGHVVSQAQYGSLIPWGQVGGTATTASIGQYLATLTATQTTHYAYDNAGRGIFAVDAAGNVTETRYDDDGRVTWTLQYANPVGTLATWNAATIAAAVQAANPDATTVRGSGNVYDGAGNVIETLDTVSATPSATYTYNNVGLKTSYTNRDGQTWTYAYNSSGNMTEETGPVVAVASYDSNGNYVGATQQAVSTYYGYDGNGNVTSKIDAYGTAQARTTQYVYDTAGNLIQTTQADPGQIDPATGVLTPTGSSPVTTTTYNALNQAVVSQYPNGDYSYQAYDQDGRLAYSIDANGYVTGYTYNAYGEQATVTRYADPVDTSVLGDSWSAGQPLTLEQVQAVLVTSFSDRTITTTYDAQGNKLSVTQPAVTYTNSDGSTATGSPVTQYTYDAYGNLTSESVLVQGTPGQAGAVWATTYNYYDALGNKTMTVDPMGYVTTNTYDAFGNVASTTQWATAIATDNLVAGGTPPADPPAGNSATTGADRITSYTYDALGNKISTSVLRTYVNASGATVQGYVTTTYGYDGENRVTSVTEDGQTVTTQYDALGHITSITGPQQPVLVSNWQALLEANPALDLSSPSLYVMASQVISYTYDALGNRLTQTQGSTGSSQQVTTYYQYDDAGRMVASLTPLDGSAPDWTSTQAKYMTYDANGNLLQTMSTQDGDDGSTVTVITSNTYDADNQLIYTVTMRSNAATPDKAVATQYDAFGEVTATGDGVVDSTSTTYDNAGNRLTSTDPTTGELHTYGYNLAGQQVSDTVPLAATVGGTASTIGTLDLDGRVIAEQAPSTNAASGENAGILHASYDRWGNVLSSTDAAGNTTTYTYNDRNQVVSQTEAAVAVVGVDGVSTVTAPVKTSSYDSEGNLIAVTDENGNTTTTAVDALGQTVKTADGAGANSYVAYDALGNEVADEDGNGNITFKNVDALGRVVQQGDFVLSSAGTSRTAVWQQAYVLDQNGNRLISYDGIGSAYLQSGDTTDAALHANYDGYDSQGRVLWSQDAAQRAASVSDTHGAPVGNWTQAPTNANFAEGGEGWVSTPGWSFGNFGSGPYGPWTAAFGGSSAYWGQTMVNEDRVPVVPGQTITAHGAFVVNSNHGGGSVRIVWYDANGNYISTSFDVANQVTAHRGPGVVSQTGTAPPGAAYAAIAVGAINYDLGNNSVYCTGVSWDYVPPAGATSTGANGAIVTYLPSGSFTSQPTNDSFSEGDTGWDEPAGWSIHSTAAAANSPWVASYNGLTPQTLTNQDQVPVTAGQTISATAQVSLYLAADGAQAAGAVVILWYDADGNLISTSEGNVVSNDHKGAWETTTVTGSAPVGAAFAAVGISGDSNGIGSVSVRGVSWNYQYTPSVPTGVVQDTYVYNMDGDLVSETTADGDTESWQYNAYGQAVTHTDLSGADYSTTYDAATGQETGESDTWSPTAQGQVAPTYVTGPIGTPNSETLTYEADGQIATETFADGSSYSYQYDANGNVVREEDTTRDGNDNLVHTVTRTGYDSHNRISTVVETDVLTGATTLDETFSYDAAGNRREVEATSDGTTQDAWYTYDGDNRVQVSDGSLSDGQILVTDTADSYEQFYDANGNVTSQLTVNAAGDTLVQRSYYDGRNERVRADYAVDTTTGGVSRGVEETLSYDADGHALITDTYYALGTTLGGLPPGKVNPDDADEEGTGTDVGGELDNATVDFYDVVGRLAEEQTFGNPSHWDGTPDTPPATPPTPDSTTYGNLTLQSEVVYQGSNGSAGYDADGDVVAYQYRDASGRVDQYQVSYLRKDGYLQSATTGVNISGTPNVQPSTDQTLYDTRGNAVALEQHTEDPSGTLADTVHVFAYNGAGEIIERQDGTGISGTSLDQGSDPASQVQHYVYVNGQQLAHYDNAGTLDVLDEVTAFSSHNDSPDSYVVQAGDTLESIAQAEYGDANLWYVLAQANGLSSDTDLSLGQRLQIPTVTTHSNSATTFKPYDPSSIVGSTTPNLPTLAPPPPPLPSQHCNALAEIVIIAVTVVVTYFTAGATSELLASELASAGVTVAAGSATAVAVGAVSVAVGAAVGNAAGQLTGEAEGVQQGFNWSEVGETGLAAGLTAGIGSGGGVLGAVEQGAINYAATDVAAKLTDQPAHFSWAGLVAQSLSSAVSSEIGPTHTDVAIGQSPLGVNPLNNIGAAAVGDVVDRETSVALGDHHVASWEQLGENVGGVALANGAVAGLYAYRQYASQQQVGHPDNSPLSAPSSQPTASAQASQATTSGWTDQEMADAVAHGPQFAALGPGAPKDPVDNVPTTMSTDGNASGVGSSPWTRVASDAELMQSQADIDQMSARGIDTTTQQQDLDALWTRQYVPADANTSATSGYGLSQGAQNNMGISGAYGPTLPGYNSFLETNADGTPALLNGLTVTDLVPVSVSASQVDQGDASALPNLVTMPPNTLMPMAGQGATGTPVNAVAQAESDTATAALAHAWQAAVHVTTQTARAVDSTITGLQNRAMDATVSLGAWGDRQNNLLGDVAKVAGGVGYVLAAPTDWKAADAEFAGWKGSVQGGLVTAGAYGDRQGGIVGGAIHVGAGLLYAADEVLQPASVTQAALVVASPAIGKVVGAGVTLLNKVPLLNANLGAAAGKLGGAVSAVTAYAKRVVGAEGAVPDNVGATFGRATSTNYRATFFEANPGLEGQVVVHHAVEQQVLTRYPGVVTEEQIHSLENLRGIPNEVNSDLHLSQIRREWNQFYRQTPNATQEQLLQKATEIDTKYGSQFNPPLGQ
jgi:YD repeat-containing protein